MIFLAHNKPMDNISVLRVNAINRRGVVTPLQQHLSEILREPVYRGIMNVSLDDVKNTVEKWRNGIYVDDAKNNLITAKHLYELKLISTVPSPTNHEDYVLRETISLRPIDPTHSTPITRGEFDVLTLVYRRPDIPICSKIMILVMPGECAYSIGGISTAESELREVLSRNGATYYDVANKLNNLPLNEAFPSLFSIIMHIKSEIGAVNFRLV